MKFRYFFIIILVVELFLQINRIVNKGNYFSVKQEISFEKAVAKSSKVKFEHPQKILVYQNTASEQSKRITKNLEEAFKYNKINYKLIDIGEVVPIAEYDVFVFATDTFIGFYREMFDGILKEVSENGKGLVFLNNTPYNPSVNMSIWTIITIKEQLEARWKAYSVGHMNWEEIGHFLLKSVLKQKNIFQLMKKIILLKLLSPLILCIPKMLQINSEFMLKQGLHMELKKVDMEKLQKADLSLQDMPSWE